jgi:hypothetical protein
MRGCDAVVRLVCLPLGLRIQADVRKARKVLGFQAEIPLFAGLSQMLGLERSH